MRFVGRSLLGLFLLALTLGILALAAGTLSDALAVRMADAPPARMARERTYAANVLTVTPGRVEPVLTGFGELRSRRTLDLRAPRAGRVIWIAPGFEEGAAVEAGQVLVRLDPADAQAVRDLAANDLARAEAELRDAGRGLHLARDERLAAVAQADLRGQALERQRNLQTRGVGSDAAVETAALAAAAAEQAVLSRRQAEAQAEARRDQAENALARQGITLAEAERALRDTELRSDFSGRLAAVDAVAGGVVGQNERLAQILDPDDLEVVLRLSTSQFSRLIDSNGALLPMPIEVFLDVMGTPITATGRLTRVGAAVGEGQSGRLIFAALDGSRGFRPGDFVTLRITEPALDGVAELPASALGAGDTLLAVGPGDRLEQVSVEVLRRMGDRVILRAPHLAGGEVVAERSALLSAGILIRPIRPAGEEAAAGDAPATLTLTPERRAALIAAVEGNTRMPAEARARLVAQLSQDEVPAQLIARIESRTGG